jgi:hypothetical protein
VSIALLLAFSQMAMARESVRTECKGPQGTFSLDYQFGTVERSRVSLYGTMSVNLSESAPKVEVLRGKKSFVLVGILDLAPKNPESALIIASRDNEIHIQIKPGGQQAEMWIDKKSVGQFSCVNPF